MEIKLREVCKEDWDYILDENNIGLRRSGNSLEAKTILKIHGKKATKKITKDQILRKEDYE